MFALSTSYFTLTDRDPAGDDIARRAAEMGYRALELDYRLTEVQLKALAPLIARGEVSVASVHHPLPRDPRIPPLQAHVERLRMSSLDPEERKAASLAGTKTLTYAEEFGAGVVVFHIGRVDLGEGIDPRSLAPLIRAGKGETQEFRDRRAEVQAARRAASRPHLEAVLSCLYRVAGEALKRSVSLGIENRYHPEEIPDREELEVLFRELRGAPVGYWHDTGHAESLFTLGFLSSRTELLEAFGDKLLGFHLHDAEGLDDHRAPGDGKLDFRELAPYARPETRLILEIHPPSPPEAVARAPRILAEAGFPTRAN